MCLPHIIQWVGWNYFDTFSSLTICKYKIVHGFSHHGQHSHSDIARGVIGSVWLAGVSYSWLHKLPTSPGTVSKMMTHSMNDSGEQGFYQISTGHVSDRIRSDNETMGWSIQSCRPHCGVYRLQPRANMDSHIKSLLIAIDVRLYQEYLNARASLKISPSPGDDAICQHDAHARCSQVFNVSCPKNRDMIHCFNSRHRIFKV